MSRLERERSPDVAIPRPHRLLHRSLYYDARAEVIRAKVSVLELAKQLGNFRQACKMMGQTWIRNDVLAPDWLRIGSDIVGGSAKFDASFSLDDVGAVPALPLFATGLARWDCSAGAESGRQRLSLPDRSHHHASNDCTNDRDQQPRFGNFSYLSRLISLCQDRATSHPPGSSRGTRIVHRSRRRRRAELRHRVA
jgi:hypothetical protein